MKDTFDFFFLMALVEIFSTYLGAKGKQNKRKKTDMNNLLQIVCLVSDEPE